MVLWVIRSEEERYFYGNALERLVVIYYSLGMTLIYSIIIWCVCRYFLHGWGGLVKMIGTGTSQKMEPSWTHYLTFGSVE
jgi:hypothetical protein